MIPTIDEKVTHVNRMQIRFHSLELFITRYTQNLTADWIV